MPNNQQLPPDLPDLQPNEIRLLASELHDFKQTRLYRHFREQQKLFFDESVHQILNEPLKGPETLYTREGWIGEARAAELQIEWFDLLEVALQDKIIELEL